MGRKTATNNPVTITIPMTGRTVLFLLFMALSIALFFAPLKLLVETSFMNELYSHILLIPFVSIYLMISGRKEIFAESRLSPIPGSVLVAVGVILFLWGKKSVTALGQNDFLSLTTFAAVTCWIGGFLLFFGPDASRRALFPLLFLLFMVPVPDFLMERIIVFLQLCSAEVSYWFFRLTGVPIFREGFTFHLPGLSVEVAKQCGGIRSSLVLFIVSILAGHLFLASWRRKIVLSLFVLPITIVKNGIRIVTLSLLGAYVDPRILDSVAHQRGGIPFFIIALSLLGIVLWVLRRAEN